MQTEGGSEHGDQHTASIRTALETESKLQKDYWVKNILYPNIKTAAANWLSDSKEECETEWH